MTWSTAAAPYRLKAARDWSGVRPKRLKKSMTSRTPNCLPYSSESFRALSADMLLISRSRSGSFSRMRRVSAPNRSTKRRAVAGPIPLIAPEVR